MSVAACFTPVSRWTLHSSWRFWHRMWCYWSPVDLHHLWPGLGRCWCSHLQLMHWCFLCHSWHTKHTSSSSSSSTIWSSNDINIKESILQNYLLFYRGNIVDNSVFFRRTIWVKSLSCRRTMWERYCAVGELMECSHCSVEDLLEIGQFSCSLCRGRTNKNQ